MVYAVEFSHRSGRDLINMAKNRTNIIPIIEDARHPLKYRMLVGMVDTVFADVAQPDQARIVALNSHYFLKNKGHFVISIKANCIDSTAAPEAVFAKEVRPAAVSRRHLMVDDVFATVSNPVHGSLVAVALPAARQTHSGELAAEGTADAGAVRARPRCGGGCVPRS